MSDEDHLEDDNSENPTRLPLTWRLADWFHRGVSAIGSRLANAAESTEWLTYHALGILRLIVMPWRWLRRAKAKAETGQETSQEPIKEPLGLVEFSEWFGFHAFGILTLVFMPWTWFRRAKPKAEADQEISNEPIKEPLGLVEFSEWFGFHAFGILTLVFMPWTWFRRAKPKAEADQEISNEPIKEPLGLVEFSEWFGFHAFGILTLIVMPWRWFYRAIPNVDTGQETAGEVAEEPAGLVEFSDWLFAHSVGVVVDFFVLMGQRALPLLRRCFPRRFFWPLYWLLDGLFAVLDFVAQWWYSRDFFKLAWSVPAILLTLPLLVSLPLAWLYSNPKRIEHYELALESAEQNKDIDAISLLRNKLTQLGHEDMDAVEFKTAAQLAEAGKFEEAYERMKWLAPLDKPGYLNAHLWIAGALIDQRIHADDPLSLLETHTDHALALAPENPFAQRFSAEVLLRRGEHDEANTALESAARAFPDLHAVLSHQYRLKGDDLKAKHHGRRAISYYATLKKRQRRRKTHPLTDLTPQGYLRIAEAHDLFNEDAAEVDVLMEALQVYPNDKMLWTTLSEVLGSPLANADLDDQQTRLQFEALCRVDRDQPLVVSVLGKGLLANDPKAMRLVDHLRSKNLLSSNVYEYVADRNFTAGRLSIAREYYHRTCELNPNASFAWNNLAWLLDNIEPRCPDEATAAVNRAIELNPDARFFETRGQILVKQERWSEAAKDLERAVNGAIPDAESVHRSLARSYDALGEPERAAAHRDLGN